ncbi:MAG: phosphoenolpyruvate carboxylase [Acetobacteraceae bacterium]|nr:phosphoenolpyruvate carboxylase [Acetobacteraceae bacterium]
MLDVLPANPPSIADLIACVAEARLRADRDPFGNPVLTTALLISRHLDDGTLDESALHALVSSLRDLAATDRARRLAAYVDATGPEATGAALARLAERLIRPDPADSPLPLRDVRALVEQPRYAAVFTAHPTFALAPDAYATLAETASGRAADSCLVSHRPPRPTLDEEFEAAARAITHGRDALDALGASILDAARPVWPTVWHSLNPCPVILASWVGYDTDGRTDIGWWDTMRLRLRMKQLQLARVAEQVAGTGTLAGRVQDALEEVSAQIALVPTRPDPADVATFARALVGGRERALLSPEPLLPLFAAAIADADPATQRRLVVARAGLLAHGLSLAHTHVRLNATQIHNSTRLRLGLDAPAEDPSRRRVLLAAMGEALEKVAPVPVDFGGLLQEQASAVRLMMVVAQITKHVDAFAPVRFLIAETESGYTLLAALWLARRFGIERHVEISPLFETADALETGGRVLEEALRSRCFRDYVRGMGRLCLQFGYSDSGRYLGQLPASYLIERLKLRVADALARHGLADIEVVLFDTHGESIGRGAHPGSLADRLDYLSPPAARAALAAAGLRVREESAIQGGDGYLLFATPELAQATVARLAEHALLPPPAEPDAIYAEPDFAADFFATAAAGMRELVEDRGYAALLGAFGPALLDPTGSRPAARQGDAGGPALIRHPRELRAIPNNAILQQLGWCANVLHGLGAACSRQPELFNELRETSPRFHRALDLVCFAAANSDLDVLRASVSLLDPGSWLDRAAHAHLPGRAQALASVARALTRLDLWAATLATVRRVQADQVGLRTAWPDLPSMSDRAVLLHALRIATIQRIWLLGTEIPEFSPRHGVTPEGVQARLLRLDVPGAVEVLTQVFPRAPDPAAAEDYGEPGAGGRGAATSYAREHETIFGPLAQLHGLMREICVAITHEVGAFG